MRIATVAVLAAIATVACTDRAAEKAAVMRLEQSRLPPLKFSDPVYRMPAYSPCPVGDARDLAARFDVRDLECGSVMLTTWPPKQDMSFEYKGSRYHVFGTVDDVPIEILRAGQPLVPLPSVDGTYRADAGTAYRSYWP